MKKYFYIVVSMSVIVLTLVGCFLLWEKHSQVKKRKERLDWHYFNELRLAYFSIFDPDANDRRINSAYDRVERTKEHMSKDGYDWQQINETEKLVEAEESKHRWRTNWGYEDAASGKDPDANYLKDSFYMYGFEKGKKTKIDKERPN